MSGILVAMQGAVAQGVLWGIMVLGVYITYRLLDIADLTVDGSFALGGCVCAALIINFDLDPLAALLLSMLAGMAAGMEIQENLALALRRGRKRGLSWGIKANEKDFYREALTKLGLGLQTRMTSKVGLLSGGQRQALTLLMATLEKPKLLLLDEHTAALDPKTAKKVLELTDEIIKERELTALMVTHNMKDAIQYGNRLIMMHEGRIIYDVAGEEKKNLQVEDLLKKFGEASGGEFANDRMMLAK